jgi:hypothetical protein
MLDWKVLSLDDRFHIEADLNWALKCIGITGILAVWIMPAKVLHWRLRVQSSWCTGKTRTAIYVALDQAIARAGITAPLNAITLCELPTKLSPV